MSGARPNTASVNIIAIGSRFLSFSLFVPWTDRTKLGGARVFCVNHRASETVLALLRCVGCASGKGESDYFPFTYIPECTFLSGTLPCCDRVNWTE